MLVTTKTQKKLNYFATNQNLQREKKNQEWLKMEKLSFIFKKWQQTFSKRNFFKLGKMLFSVIAHCIFAEDKCLFLTLCLWLSIFICIK